MASLAGREFRAGEPILLGCTLKNGSRKDFVYYPDFFYRHHYLIVLNDKGREPPLTDIGEGIQKSADNLAGKNRFLTVKAGGEYKSLGQQFPQNDLAKIYRLAPGDYSIVVEYRKEMIIKSNTINFRVR